MSSMTGTERLVDELTGSGIRTRPAGPDDAFDGSMPGLVASPQDADEVARVVGAAAAAGASLAVRGNGTKATWGLPARDVDLMVDTRAMNRLVEHEPGDLIATAQAGMPLTALQDALAGSGQRLGIDEMVPGSTVGGLVATNPSGPRRLHTGTVRDLVIGLRMVRPDGVSARAGGKVVKNVAGYDLCKLMTGSWGTLGVVTEVTFRLHPIPEDRRWLVADVPQADLPDVLAQVTDSQLAPSAVEVAADANGTRLMVLLEGTRAGVPSRVSAMTSLLGPGAHAEDAEEPAGYPFRVGGTQVGLKLTCTISHVPQVTAVALRLGLRVRGSAGTGVLYAAAPDGIDADALTGILQELRREAAAAGGSVTVVDGPRAVRGAVDVWGPVPALAVMARIKDEFDPGHRLSPGRFVGGI